MAGIASLAKSSGHKVTGCDQNVYPPMSTQLKDQGITIIEGFGKDQISLNPDIYITVSYTHLTLPTSVTV